MGLLVAMVGVVPVAGASPSGRASLSPTECNELVEEGKQARDDLAKLIEGQAEDQGSTGTTATTTPEIASYVADLLTSAAVNTFGFVSASAGAPLDLCLPEGTTTLTMFSEPVVLWEGQATSDAYPVTVVIPTDVECGTHTLQATGPAVDESVQFEVQPAVTTQAAGEAGAALSPCAAAAAGGGLLPRTGAEIGRVVAMALALVAAGYAVLTARRARRAAR